MTAPATPDSVRIDKWLWAVRLFKTRTAAADACRGGHVQVNDQPAKPAREIRVGDLLQARTGDLRRTVRVLGLVEHRVGAPAVAELLLDLTPAGEYEKRDLARRDAAQHRDPGSGRPTKRDRRLLEAWISLP